MIGGRENYSRAINFQGPERLPAAIGCDINWLYDNDPAKREVVGQLQSRFPHDLDIFGEGLPGLKPQTVENGVKRWVDEWGTGWEDDGHGGKTEGYPMEDAYDWESFHLPDAHDQERFAGADKEMATPSNRYKCGTVWFTLFERLWMLRGFNNMLMDPYVDEDNFTRLRDTVLEHNLAKIDHWLERDIDAIYFSDDWGCQRGLLMNPDDWRKFYKPAYKAMFDRVKGGGKHVWMHLCGNVTDIVGDLIDCGLDVLNPVQPQAMDVNYLSREFGGKVCFWGGVDVQGTLVRGSQEDVKREIDTLVKLFGSFNGGYIGGTSHSVMPETPLDNVIAMYAAFVEYL